MVTDPVCGRQITPDEAIGESTYEGETYYFCSEECRSEFKSDPTRFASALNV